MILKKPHQYLKSGTPKKFTLVLKTHWDLEKLCLSNGKHHQYLKNVTDIFWKSSPWPQKVTAISSKHLDLKTPPRSENSLKAYTVPAIKKLLPILIKGHTSDLDKSVWSLFKKSPWAWSLMGFFDIDEKSVWT